jgi:hypothetical protein
MSVAGISSTALTQTLAAPQSTPGSSQTTSTWQAYIKERHPEVVALGEALQSGNLSAAEQAYNNLVALGNTLPGDNPFVRSDRALDFNAIGGALANGNLGQAQQAFAQLRATFGQKLPPVQGSSGASPDAVVTLSSSGVAPAASGAVPEIVPNQISPNEVAANGVAPNPGISNGSSLESILNLLSSGQSSNGVNTLA